MTRSLKCMKLNARGMLVTVSDYQCSHAVKPTTEEKCNTDIECPSKQICKHIYDICHTLVRLDPQSTRNKLFRLPNTDCPLRYRQHSYACSFHPKTLLRNGVVSKTSLPLIIIYHILLPYRIHSQPGWQTVHSLGMLQGRKEITRCSRFSDKYAWKN